SSIASVSITVSALPVVILLLFFGSSSCELRYLSSFPTRRSSDLRCLLRRCSRLRWGWWIRIFWRHRFILWVGIWAWVRRQRPTVTESARVAQLLFTLLSLSLGLGNTCAPIILCRLRLRWWLRWGFWLRLRLVGRRAVGCTVVWCRRRLRRCRWRRRRLCVPGLRARGLRARLLWRRCLWRSAFTTQSTRSSPSGWLLCWTVVSILVFYRLIRWLGRSGIVVVPRTL